MDAFIIQIIIFNIMSEKDKQPTFEDLNKILFPSIYGLGSNDDSLAQQLYQFAIKYANLSKECIFSKEGQRVEVIQRLTKFTPEARDDYQSLKIIFFCKYGSLLKFTKQQKYSPINIKIITLEGWQTGSHDHRSSKLNLVHYGAKTSIYNPTITTSKLDLGSFSQLFVENVRKEIIQIVNERLKGQIKGEVQDTYTDFEKAVKRVCVYDSYSTTFSYKQKKSVQKQQKQQKQPNQQVQKQVDIIPLTMLQIKLNIIQAATPWYLVRSIIYDLIGFQMEDRWVADKFIIGFQGCVLRRATAIKCDYDRNKVGKFKLCLDQLIFNYREKCSGKNKDVERFNQMVKNIEANILSIKGEESTSQIQNIPNFYEKLDLSVPQKATIIDLKVSKFQKKPIIEVLIQEYEIKLQKRYIIQQLLQLYVQAYNKSQQLNKWVLLAQRQFWSLSEDFNHKERIDQLIHMRQIQCEMGYSSLLQLVITYQSVVRRNKNHFGLQLGGQAQSHIQLFKAIASIIAFQAVSLNRQRRGSNLQKYKIPLNIHTLYTKFQSLSFEARMAMRNVRNYYDFRKHNKSIFEMRATCNDYFDYAKSVFEQTRSARFWIKYMDKLSQAQQSSVAYQSQVKRRKDNDDNLKKRGVAYIQAQQSKIPVSQLSNYLDNNKSVDIQNPTSYYNKSAPWVAAFLNNIPPDLLGLIKVLFEAQNPKTQFSINEQTNSVFTNNVLKQESPINIYIPKNPSTQLISPLNVNQQSITISDIYNTTYIVYNGMVNSAGYQEAKFFEEPSFYESSKSKQIKQLLSTFIIPPQNSMRRQHKVYSQLARKPREFQVQNYLAMCNVRSGVHTQLMLLCSGILQRKIISNSYDDVNIFPQRLIIQTMSSINAYHPQTERQFQKIKELILKFKDVWIYSDTNFCPVLVPMITVLGRELIKDNPNYSREEIEKIKNAHFFFSMKCWKEFERLEQELKQKPDISIRWDQRYIMMAALSCFREVQLKEEEQIKHVLKLIFFLRTTKILSDRQIRPQKKRPFQTELLFAVEKAIYSNISAISSYTHSHHNELNKIIIQLDKDLPSDIVWVRRNRHHFRGCSDKTKDIYQLDIYKGCVYKNGKQVSCLDKCVKQNKYFKEIFGTTRQFQVFPTKQPFFLRTRDCVNHYFKINPQNGEVYLEFSEDGSIIRYVIKKINKDKTVDEQIWTLIPRQRLKQSACHIPLLFMQNYLAWMSEKRRAVMFRRPKFQRMYEIGIVIFLGNSSQQIVTASYITYAGSYQNQNMQQICNRNSQKYDEIILRKNNAKLQTIKPFQAFSNFQPATYIFELRSRKQNSGTKTKNTFYLLYRYQMKFRVVNQSRLVSQTHFGYALDYCFRTQSNCLFNLFSCLVLEKYENNIALQNNHNRIVIIRDGIVSQNGQISQYTCAQTIIKPFKYDIHDYFGDLRGVNRESILHLAVLMLSINDNIKIKQIQMTPLQYCMYLMKSCFTNRPFLENQKSKLANIFKFGTTEVTLLGESLLRISDNISTILPFPISDNSERKKLKEEQVLFLKCKTLYEKNYYSNQVRYRQKLNQQFLQFIGMTIKVKKARLKGKFDDSSQQEEALWKGINNITSFYDQKSLKKILADYIEFTNKTAQFNKQAKQVNKSNSKKQAFPSQIDQVATQNKQDLMTKEMIDELKHSFAVYTEQQQKIDAITNKIKGNKKKQLLKGLNELQKSALNILMQIQKVINNLKGSISNHPDIISGLRPTLAPAMYTSVLCSDELLEYFPGLAQKAKRQIQNMIKIWMDLKTRIASLQRIKLYLSQQTIDTVAFLRETESPRKQVFQKNQWLCFEAQMKVQLWPSQLQTYKNLIQGKSGAFCQLNMGQGKTQVIIPLMILNAVYSTGKKSQRYIPRINLLSSLFEEARGNFFRFISATGFQIPCFQLPFNRKVQLTVNQINKVKNLISAFSKKVYILVSRESRLSEILRFQEGKITRKRLDSEGVSYLNKCYRKDRQFKFDFGRQDFEETLIPSKVFDIFDEIDALMYCKKSYIYSIGDQIELQKDSLRFEVLRLCIEVFLTECLDYCLQQKIVVSDETDQQTIKIMKNGEYPPGLRIISSDNKKQMLQIRRMIATKLVLNMNRHEYSFQKLLKTPKDIEQLIKYLTESDCKFTIKKILPQAAWPQIYLLRGALAYGILQHCLAMRCGVNYGAPNSKHLKRIAVPYQAADIPSRTSQYQQPDVSIILSNISYYTKGLTELQMDQCLRTLLQMSNTSKSNQYLQWMALMEETKREKFQFQKIQNINYNSQIHRELLFNTFKKNRKTVSFWLIKCVFSKDLKQFAKSITSSAWDLADVEKSIGFSGTKDNRWLYSNLLHWKPCKSPQIMGTDGKMVHLITKFTRNVCLIAENEKTLWQRFVDLALEKKVGCIIDAGALCVGKSLKDEIVPWIASHSQFDSKYLGISFCDNSGSWFVYDIKGKYYVPRGTTIPDHQTFVIFDQARTRGADLKMDADVVAALSIGPDLTKDSLMQAAGRLRKLGRNQCLIIMATHEVFNHLPNFPQDTKQQNDYIKKAFERDNQLLPKQLIAYCCKNSMNDNRDLLMQFAQLGWKYVHSKVNNQAFEQSLTTQLGQMYSSELKNSNVYQIGVQSANRKSKKLIEHPSGKHIVSILQKFGKIIPRQGGTLDDICEREVQAQKQKQKQQENEYYPLTQIPQRDPPQYVSNTMKSYPIIFDTKFKMTSNLLQTTNSIEKKPCQIPELYFLKISKQEMIAISIREASNFIQKSIIGKQQSQFSLHLLNQLTIQSAKIKENQMKGALVSAKFFAGVEDYSSKQMVKKDKKKQIVEEQQQLLLQLFIRNKKQKIWANNYNDLVSLFLRLKRIYLKKFTGSSLQKLITRLYNEG